MNSKFEMTTVCENDDQNFVLSHAYSLLFIGHLCDIVLR